MKAMNRIVTSISIREDLKKLIETAIKNGHFPAGINNFSSAIEHLIEKELKEA